MIRRKHDNLVVFIFLCVLKLFNGLFENLIFDQLPFAID